MRRLVAINHVSVDGVMQSPGGPHEDPRENFDLGGWVARFWTPQLRERLDRSVAGPFDLVLGRRTYEIFAAYWPDAGDNPVTHGFNRATKHVATRGRPDLGWAGSVALAGDAVEGVRRLKQGQGPELQIYGSATLLQALIAADLVDEYVMRVFPVVLGRGRRLFEAGAPPRALRLIDSEGSTTGVLTNRYVPDGPVTAGSMRGEGSPAELARRHRLAAESG